MPLLDTGNLVFDSVFKLAERLLEEVWPTDSLRIVVLVLGLKLDNFVLNAE